MPENIAATNAHSPRADRVLSTILRHDAKQNSYKIALLCAINEVALAFPDVSKSGVDVAVPLRLLAERWIAYYWPFVHPAQPILQGPRAELNGVPRSDMSFRNALSALRREAEADWGGWATLGWFFPGRRDAIPPEAEGSSARSEASV